MSDVRLRPMTPDEYDEWRWRAIVDYAEQKKDAAGWTDAEAGEKARAEHDAILTAGLDTPGQLLLTAIDDDDKPVGDVWLAEHAGREPWLYLYKVEVHDDRRGEGLGRATMLAIERFAREGGAAYVELNVFAHNTVARGLYDSLGYQPTSTHLRKDIIT